MPRRSVISSLLFLLAAAPVGAQVVDETLVPQGRLRLRMAPAFSAWDQQFGGASGSQREDLGADLTDPTGSSLFPGIASLEERLRELIADPGYTAVLGSTEGFVQQDVTRIDFGAHVGVFDWLTVGVVVPWVRTRTAIGLAFAPDTLAGNLGLNPTIGSTEAVLAFLDGLSTARGAAQSRADGLCAASPGSASCAGAQALSDQVESLRASTEAAYFTTGFFPLEGSSAAGALVSLVDGLSSDLAAAGLSALTASMPFATSRPTTADIVAMPAQGGSGIGGAPLTGVDPLWAVGDIELSALARVLQGTSVDGSGAPSLRYSLLAGATVRLGTGSQDDDAIFLDIGTGDGQMDVEGRLLGEMIFGSTFGVRAGARYGSQAAFSLLRRVGPPEQVLLPAGTLRAVRWSPGAYLAFEAEPALRLSDALSITGEYRFFSKGDDRYELIGEVPPDLPPVDIADLERETSVTLQEVGLGVRFTSLAAGPGGSTGRPMEAHARYIRPLAGSGGRTPAASRVEFGVTFFRGIWGGS